MITNEEAEEMEHAKGINEIKELKWKLENEVEDLLNKFTLQTGCKVDGIEVEHDPNCYHLISGLEIHLSIPHLICTKEPTMTVERLVGAFVNELSRIGDQLEYIGDHCRK